MDNPTTIKTDLQTLLQVLSEQYTQNQLEPLIYVEGSYYPIKTLIRAPSGIPGVSEGTPVICLLSDDVEAVYHGQKHS